jgi:hypothetical protein
MINLNDIRNTLFQISKKDFPAGKMVAAVAVRGKTTWFGANSRRSHPRMVRKFRNGEEGSCCHAEVNALLQVPRQCRPNIELYVIRFLRNGAITMAKPCDYCQDFLEENNVPFRNVFYTDWNWDGTWSCLADST